MLFRSDHANSEPNAQLRAFAENMADDIESEDSDHVTEPMFPDEA